ncbi:hypothetical protein K3495_g2077 [Podosphaera aphanis]|nr:hypothetical protein K3495_g2077 [Podosphaera aphanis]
MSTGHLDHDDFFARLAALFNARRQSDHGSIFLTQKRMSYENDEIQEASAAPPSKPMPIIIRATDGNSKDQKKDKVKLSTIVESDALEPFFVRYGEVCKAGMTGMKKRDRSKAKEKLKARKKKLNNGPSVLPESKKS